MEAFMTLLSDFGVSSMFVMYEQLLTLHPFVVASFMDPARGYEQDAATEGEREVAGELVADFIGHSSADARVANVKNSVQSAGAGGAESESGRNLSSGVAAGAASVLAPDTQQDLKPQKEFFIDDKLSLGPACFVGTKSVGAGLNGRVGNPMIAVVVVRKRGTGKFSKLHRFMYTVPQSIQGSLNTWVAVAKPGSNLKKALFHEIRGEGGSYQELKELTQNLILANCPPLKFGQVLLSLVEVSEMLGLEGGNSDKERDVETWFELFYSGWFSSKIPTEPMMTGTIKEQAVLSALTTKKFLKEVFEIVMVTVKDLQYLLFFPDGVPFSIGYFRDSEADLGVDSVVGDEPFVLAAVEIKTRVAASSLGAVKRYQQLS
ncbi:hypothetical protein BWQ96_00945 [Gracilariopsis chorda]|uniref:Uncharacterized protein n=1 Tax=Gracilariopsis chorda TaxID=448386 RepID=A0A2V3J4J1_9FLOR|nr:hypothetical protein BWQ96_00945 [Gracilariopsis chorda]|eukprot:PXF49371.1 hypothetical protein BWQ96_00945 [Gracilariopsis chorda]